MYLCGLPEDVVEAIIELDCALNSITNNQEIRKKFDHQKILVKNFDYGTLMNSSNKKRNESVTILFSVYVKDHKRITSFLTSRNFNLQQ